jgi:hypothetical protein
MTAAITAKVNPALALMAQVTQPVVNAYNRLLFELGPVTRTLGAFGSALSSASSAAGAAMTAAAAATTAALDAPARAIASAVAPMKAISDAAWKITAPFQQLAGSISPFVDALNPALARELSFAMRELMASVGLLVQPIAQELAPLLREVAASLQPAFRALAPVVASLAQTMGRVIAVIAQAFAGALAALAPALKALADLVGQVVTAMAPLLSVSFAVIASLAPMLKTMVEAVAPVFSTLAKAMVYLTAAILKTVGAVGILDGMIAATKRAGERGPQSSGLQSVQNAQYSGYADLGRSLALSSTLAGQTSKEPEKDMKDLTAEILRNLEQIKGGDTWGPLKVLLKDALTKLREELVSGLKGGVYEGATGAAAAGVFGPVGVVADRLGLLGGGQGGIAGAATRR